MAISFKNYSKTTSNDSQELTYILTGSSGGTVIKSLELINSDQSCTVHIVRKDNANNVYADVRVDLKANDYLILWQGFFVIPYNYTLYFSSNVKDCTVVANVVELT